MLKKFRRKIIWINVSLVGVVLLGVFVAVCMNTYHASRNDILRSLQNVMESEKGVLPEKPMFGGKKEFKHSDSFRLSSYINVIVDRKGNILRVNRNNAEIEEQVLEAAIESVMASEKNSNTIRSLHLIYEKRMIPEGYQICFTDSSSLTAVMVRSILVYLLLFIIGITVIGLISIWLSLMAIKPIQQAWSKQKQFIADASHELKTPLTIILANNNILQAHPEDTIAMQKQWIESTSDEAKRMKKLIDEMLMLAKAETEEPMLLIYEFDLSMLLDEQLLYFEPVAFEQGVKLEGRIAPDIKIVSDEAKIKQLIQIFLDNAIKYSDKGKEVLMTLEKLPSGFRISINNKGEVIPEQEMKYIFDRFYRVDKSRKRGSYGLGLAIAQNLSESLKLKIRVSSNNIEGTTFYVET